MDNLIQSISTLSPLQNGMLYSWLLEKDSRAFFEQLSFNIKGDFDVKLFENSFKTIVHRYDIFRTVFVYEDLAFPRQVVLKEREVKLNFIDVSSLGIDKTTEFTEQYKKRDIEKGFDITRDILIRISILQIGLQTYKLIISFHHIIIDGWSFNIVLNELFKIYKLLKENKPLKLEPVQPYKYFIDWIENQDKVEASSFWKKYLKDFKEQTPIFCSDNNQEQTYGQRDFIFELEENMKEDLVALAKRYRVTLNTLCETAWGLLLQKYNNVNDAVFGRVVSGRGTTELSRKDSYVGLCINTIPIRIKCKEEDVFSQLIKRVHKMAICLEKYSYFSLMEIQSNTRLKKNLFDHIIVFENYPVERDVKDLIGGRSSFDFTINNIELFETVNFNIYISIMVTDKILIKTVYKTSLYDEKAIAIIFGHYKEILKKTLENPDILIDKIEILTETEKKKIIYEFNNFSSTEYAKKSVIHELFEEQVNKFPNQIAVLYNNRAFTYNEINIISNRFARKLKEKGVQPDDIVGIMVEHSHITIIGIISVLKAGGAYLPIDSEYPKERISLMLKDSIAQIILTEKSLTGKISFKGEVILLDEEEKCQGKATNIENTTMANNLMYITYTSGSTGKPKGVMIEHRNVVSYINAFNKEYNLTYMDSVLQLSSYCFDTFVEEVFPALLRGSKLVIPKKNEAQNLDALSKLIHQYQVSVISSTPQILNELGNYSSLLSSIRLFISGGDVLKPDHISNLSKTAKVYNTYGPTETTICASYYECPLDLKFNIPIGRPISNYRIYILDKNKTLTPIGVIGEIFISGDGVARGYLNMPELSADRFLPDPFINGQRMYKTGDLGRWLPDGNIQFMGRNDNQVKIRGIRVELGEIERCLLCHENIKEAVVLFQENKNNGNYLHAYIVSDPELKSSKVMQYLSMKLPKYMIPSKYTRINKIPLTLNGKINYSSLKELRQSPEKRRQDEAPININEVKFVKIWSEIFKQKVGIHDNFFNLGGDSLEIIKMMPILYKEGIELSIQDFYQYPTIKELSKKIDEVSTNCLPSEEDNSKYTIINLHNDGVSLSGKKNSFSNILLTGATGFLGIHILDEILQKTQSIIFCLVRGSNEYDSIKRFLELLRFYHGDKYKDLISKRIILINGDITLDSFGLSESEYHELGNKIDLVIHTAALVKYFGQYEEFEKVNVLGTNRIINFANNYKTKLGYISTISISGNGLKQKQKNLIFTENDFFNGQNYMDSVYVKSKFEAESLVLKSINMGLDAAVFRVGNLTGRFTDGQFQFNINENMFYCFIKSIIESRFLPDNLLECDIEFTPVDYCSKAIVGLLEIPESSRKIFHVFNHKTVKVDEILKVIKQLGISIDVLQSFPNADYFTRYYDILVDEDYRVNVSSEITCNYLRQVNLDWPEISAEYMWRIIEHIKSTDFLKENLII